MPVLWLVDKLDEYGLHVVEHPGWQTRGHANVTPKVVVVHHTASNPPAPIPSLGVCLNGRPDVPGPLCNVLIGRDGTCHVLAAGVANNAGSGGFDGISGNRNTLGIEVENDGVSEPWTPALYSVTVRAAAALADGAGIPVSRVIGHKEWTPRKIDPRLDMGLFRTDVATVTTQPTAPPEEGSPMDFVGRLDTPEGDGCWILLADGSIWTGGNAAYFGGANQHMQPLDRATQILPRGGGYYGYTILTVQSPTIGFTYPVSGADGAPVSGTPKPPVNQVLPAPVVDRDLVARLAAAEQTVSIARAKAVDLVEILG
jgi:hypothetical protein